MNGTRTGAWLTAFAVAGLGAVGAAPALAQTSAVRVPPPPTLTFAGQGIHPALESTCGGTPPMCIDAPPQRWWRSARFVLDVKPGGAVTVRLGVLGTPRGVQRVRGAGDLQPFPAGSGLYAAVSPVNANGEATTWRFRVPRTARGVEAIRIDVRYPMRGNQTLAYFARLRVTRPSR